MSGTIDIRPQDVAIVRAILATFLPPNANVWVFGSRANGRAHRGSDLDLAVDAGRRLSDQETSDINYALEDSDLPYTVDVVDLQTVSPAFRAIIERKPMVPLTLA